MRDEPLHPGEQDAPSGPSLDSLPLVGLTRRRIALLVAGFVALWLVGVFSRQVGDVSAAAGQADQMRQRNATASAEVASLQRELRLVETPAYVQEMARAYGLGSPREVPFSIDPDASPLPSGAPGSVGIVASQHEESVSPLDAWLEILFGSGRKP